MNGEEQQQHATIHERKRREDETEEEGKGDGKRVRSIDRGKGGGGNRSLIYPMRPTRRDNNIHLFVETH